MKAGYALTFLVVCSAMLGGVAYAADGPGDMNCDGIVDYTDIDLFVAALGCEGGDPSCWASDCPWINADCNEDGLVTYADIDAFVARIGSVYDEGACCFGDGSCTEEREGDCAGAWMGVGTTCDPNPCPLPEGACCYDDGSCTVAEEADCDGDWLGTGTDCTPNPCPQPIGACCYADGTCAEVTEAACTGNWLGLGTDCTPNPCPQPIGACCYADGTCAEVTEAACTGNWLGLGTDCTPNPCPQPGNLVMTQLAGNALTQYPYFEYVKAFSENAPLQVAIDPTRFPGIVGRMCDIYVVEAKTATGWAADPSLVDVTSGGAMTVTFSGNTIQVNTFTVAAAYDLDSSVYEAHTGNYTGLGHAYDVVLDCNRNGQLDSGDYIDGYGNEAGLYVVHDTAGTGPLAVTETIYSGGSWLDQDLYYPTAIATMGQLPVIVISHGNGHNYQWYDHIGTHMASYGFIVMSHSNNTGPGIETASTTTLTNTDYLLGHLSSIAGGALQGHVDGHRIMWIGHSRGGEGITRAYDRLYDGAYTPTYFTIDDVWLLSSMLPTDFLKTSSSNPHDVNYHLWTASGDNDVNGSASCDLCQTFHLHERADYYRQSTVVQGTGHGDFHASSGSVFTGPCHIEPKSVVHDIMQGYFLPLAKHYLDGNIPAQDFLWRQYEHFHPIGVDTSNPCIVVSHEYRNGGTVGNFMIDDFETNTSAAVSSSGGSVSYTVQNLTEGRLDDNNTSFSWTSSDPFNGATQDSSEGSDNGRGIVFDWNGTSRYIEWEIIPSERDLSDDLYLSFRGAQGTQHPYTLAVMGDLTFSVTLRDGMGRASSINIGAYGGGLEQPYARSGGWHNEMEVIRIRLTDFLNNGAHLDMTNVAVVRLDVGPSWGSNEGRIVIDEVMITNDAPPNVFVSIGAAGSVPSMVPPGEAIVVDVNINAVGDEIVPGSALAHYRYDGGSFVTMPLVPQGGTLYRATLPAPTCSDTPEFYFSVEGVMTGEVTDPATGTYEVTVGELITAVYYDFETDPGWTVAGDATDGQWDRGIPVDCERGDPPADYDGSGRCWLTDNSAASECNSDVDNGTTTLTSQTIDVSGLNDPVVAYARWYCNNAGSTPETDTFTVEVSSNGGTSWVELEHVGPTGSEVGGGWYYKTFRIADFVTPTAQFRIRFHASDLGDGSVVEAGIDAFGIYDFQCE